MKYVIDVIMYFIFPAPNIIFGKSFQNVWLVILQSDLESGVVGVVGEAGGVRLAAHHEEAVRA